MSKVRSCLLALALIPLAGTVALAQQQRRITGRVTDQANQQPVAGASVQVVGTTLGTYTGTDGNFALSVPQGAISLRVRRLGYRQTTVPVTADQSTVNVSLMADVLQLETQVVTGTATSISTRNAANAITVVSGAQLNRAPSQTIDNALQGKVPGAIITTNSGAPGGGTQVQIRGVTSILGNSSPLYVVDGVAVDNTAISNGLNAISGASGGNLPSSQDQQVNRIADLNPEDIASIEVLKGASAGAIYGSRGSNGVIVITTKRGQQGRPRVGITQRFGTFDLARKLGSRCFGSGEELATWAVGTPESAEDSATFNAYVGEFNAAPVKCRDYEQEMYGQNDLSYETNMSVSGGNQATTYFVSGLVKRDAGIQENTGYNKQSVRANLGQLIGDRLNLQVNTEFIHTRTERGLSGNDNNGVSPYTIFSSTPSYFDFTPVDGVFPVNPYLPYGANPLQIAALLQTPENVYRFIGGGSLSFAAYSSQRQTLDLTLRGGLDSYSDRSKIYSTPALIYEPADGLAGTVVNSNANILSFNTSLSAVHRFIARPFTATTSLGANQSQRSQNIASVTGRGLPPQATNVDAALQIAPTEFQQLLREVSYFAQEEILTLGERLLLTAGVNAEKSSVNGDDDKLYFYPKFAASYRLPVLPSVANEIKLRLAYGKAGNQPRYGDRYTSLITSLNDGVIGGRGSTILGNSNIKPETSSELEGGVDVQLFNGRLGANITGFRKQVDDLILQAAVAPSTGFTSRVINGGQLVNKGLEIGLNAVPVQAGAFTWTSTTTFALVRGKITRLDVPAFNAGSYFATDFGAVKIEEGKSPTQVITRMGCNVALDANGRCTSIKYGAVGDQLPDFQMGFANEFTMGPVRLSGLVDWRKGGMAVNLTNLYFDGSSLGADTAASSKRLRDYRAGIGVFAEDASFVKIREISLSYSLPEALITRLLDGRARSIRLELSGRNLYTWTPYTGLDPEVSNFGSQNIGRFQDVTPFPPSRSFFFSLIADF